MSRIAGMAVSNTAYSFDMLFSYAVPENMPVQCGCRALVPFGRGNKPRIGVVMTLDEGDCSGLKEISALVDDTPVISCELLRLAVWLRENTFCTYFEAVKAMLPPGMSVTVREKYSLDSSFEDFSGLSAEAAKLLEAMRAGGNEKKVQEIAEAAVNAGKRALVSELCTKGALTSDSVFSRAVGDASVKMVRLTDAYISSPESFELTPKQRKTADFLMECGCASEKELAYMCGVTPAVIKRLAVNGAAQEYEQEVMRAVEDGSEVKRNPEDIKDKTVLVLAGYYIPHEVKKRVVQFNKANPEYRIVMKEYHTYDTMEDGMAGYNRLNMDILGRGLPDILIADSYFPVASYISKGLVADIDTLIRADEELSQTEFLENVFDAYRIEGKLYYVTPSFSVNTLIGKESLVGNRTSWTMKEMQELLASMPEGTQSIGELTRSDFVQMMIQYCGNDFIDAKDGKCDFNNENFVAMLEYAKSLPEEIDWSEMGEDYWVNQDLQYRENRTILAKCDVSDTRYVNDYINGYFGEEISYIGFPSDTGTGAVVEADEQYLLSAKSEHLEGAWEFVRYYLTEEYQREVIGFPVNKMIFEERAMEATKSPYTIDRNGNKQEYEYKMSIGGESVVLPNMTTEQVDEFIEFVESIDKCVYYDEDIEAIINEEVALFFAGQKSASDIARVIQSRVEIYVNESR